MATNKNITKENILAVIIGILLFNTFYTYISSTWFFHHIDYANTILTIAAFIVLISFLSLYLLKKFSLKKMFICIIAGIVACLLFYGVFASAVLAYRNYVDPLLMIVAFVILISFLIFLSTAQRFIKKWNVA